MGLDQKSPIDRVPGEGPTRQAQILLALLLGAMILAFMGRVILGLLIKPIPADLGLADRFPTLAATLLGAGMALLATALQTDHLFHSENAIGNSVAIVSGLSSILAMRPFLFRRPALPRASAAID